MKSEPQLFVPAICSLDGGFVVADPKDIDILHHETAESAKEYPLQIEKGEFFSEIFAASFPEREKYQKHILDTLKVITDSFTEEVLPYEQIDVVGKRIQELDVAIARPRIGQPLDIIHQQYGPNPSHPYRKVTLIRTTVPVRIGEETRRFFFEKFLVVYSFLDEGGKRRSTITPIHSHPYNHEVVYFVKHGVGSKAVEKEYVPTDKSGAPFISEEGFFNPALISADGSLSLANLQIQFKKEETLEGTDEPISLEPFDTEYPSRNPDFISKTDGLFRPHQVTIHDTEEEGGTLYYAFNNYWGPLGRVIVYNDSGEPLVWSHKEWDK